MGLLLLLLAAMDVRVRDRLVGVGSHDLSRQTQRDASALVDEGWARTRWLIRERGPMTVFVVAGAALFVLMFRT
jgi:hypothetical protein